MTDLGGGGSTELRTAIFVFSLGQCRTGVLEQRARDFLALRRPTKPGTKAEKID